MTTLHKQQNWIKLRSSDDIHISDKKSIHFIMVMCGSHVLPATSLSTNIQTHCHVCYHKEYNVYYPYQSTVLHKIKE